MQGRGGSASPKEVAPPRFPREIPNKRHELRVPATQGRRDSGQQPKRPSTPRDDGRVDDGALEERIKMTSRVVPSRPSWVDEPDWSKWPEEVQERVRAAKATYSVDDE